MQHFIHPGQSVIDNRLSPGGVLFSGKENSHVVGGSSLEKVQLSTRSRQHTQQLEADILVCYGGSEQGTTPKPVEFPQKRCTLLPLFCFGPYVVVLLDHCPLSLGHHTAFAGHDHFTIDPDLLCNPVSPGPSHCCLALWPPLLDTTNQFLAMSTQPADFATFGVSSSIQGQSLVEIPLHCIASYLLNGEPKQRRLYPSAFKS